MIKVIGKGLDFISKNLTKENFELLIQQFDKLGLFESEEESETCEVLSVDFLSRESLKSIFDNYGTKEFEGVAMLKGEYDKKRDTRVFFIQKLDDKNKQINEFEILCVYATNVDSEILGWFVNKNMVLIKK